MKQDNFFEHEFHTEKWDKNCSTCYNERQAVLNKPCGVSDTKKVSFELAEERSAHPSNNYWG